MLASDIDEIMELRARVERLEEMAKGNKKEKKWLKF